MIKWTSVIKKIKDSVNVIELFFFFFAMYMYHNWKHPVYYCESDRRLIREPTMPHRANAGFMEETVLIWSLCLFNGPPRLNFAKLNTVWFLCSRFLRLPEKPALSGQQGRIQDFWKGVSDSISFFLYIPWKWNTLVSLRPNYFIFIGYLKTGGGEGAWTPSGSANGQWSRSSVAIATVRIRPIPRMWKWL